MTIAEIKEKLSQEHSFGSRFPVRIIFVENLNEYSVLEHQLKGICDVTMNVADFCRAPDTVPQFDKIRQKLSECEGQHVLLLSVGEYLRICTKRELNPEHRQFRAFWESQQPEASKTRVIIPVFNCRDVFDCQSLYPRLASSCTSTAPKIAGTNCPKIRLITRAT